FPEPDLLPLVLDEGWIADVKKNLPELPEARRARFEAQYGLARRDVEQLTTSPEIGDYFEDTVKASGDARAVFNWVTGEVQASLRDRGCGVSALPVRPGDLAQLLGLIKEGTVSHTAAKRIFVAMLETGKPPAQIAADQGLVKVGDDAALEGWVD